MTVIGSQGGIGHAVPLSRHRHSGCSYYNREQRQSHSLSRLASAGLWCWLIDHCVLSGKQIEHLLTSGFIFLWRTSRIHEQKCNLSPKTKKNHTLQKSSDLSQFTDLRSWGGLVHCRRNPEHNSHWSFQPPSPKWSQGLFLGMLH